MRNRRWFVAATVMACLTVSACGTPENGTAVVGVVVDYQGDLVSVDSFTVRTADGEEIELRPTDDGEFAFPLPHLREHMATADPIEVRFIEENGTMVATAVSDAG